jgi:DNA-binding response OmpR family regulator
LQISRDGSRGLSSSEYQAIVAGRSQQSFVVCVPDQLVLNFGRQLSLGQKRVMMPLLLHLLRHADESFSMLELARSVWGASELTPTVQTKVKVAVSRLRALLGKGRHYIITTRKMENGESVVAYQAAPQLPFTIVEAAPRE